MCEENSTKRITYTIEQLMLLKKSPLSQIRPVLLESMGEINIKKEVEEESDEKNLEQFLCPSVRKTTCQWKGPLSSLFEHFNDIHGSSVVQKNEYVLKLNSSIHVNSCTIIKCPNSNYFLKFVHHIDGYCYFYLANIDNSELESYTAQFTSFDNEDIEVNIKSATVRLRSDYKALYNKIHIQSLFKTLNAPNLVKIKFIFN